MLEDRALVMNLKTKLRYILTYVSAFTILLCAPLALGQSANYENVVFGGRTSGMAGASIALSDEPSAAFYNPAGLALLDDEVFGISVQAYGGRGLYIDGFLQVGDQSRPLSSMTFGAFPSSMAYSFPLQSVGSLRHAMALSIVSPVHQKYSYSQTLEDDGTSLSAAASLRENEYLGGLSYSLNVGRLSLGFTGYAEYASLAFENLLVSQGDDLGSLSRTRQTSGTHLGLTGIAGAHVQINSNWSVGLRARLPNLRVQSSSLHAFAEAESSDGAIDEEHRAVGGLAGDMRYPHPLGLAFGLGFQSRRIRFAFDAKAYLPLKGHALFDAPLQAAMPPARTSSWDPDLRVPKSRLVVNIATGAEVYAVEGISLLFGLSSDTSARPKGALSETGLTSSMSFINVSSGIRLQSGANAFTFAFVARHGSGTVPSIVSGAENRGSELSRIEESSGMLTMSWTRSLSKTLRALRRQVDGIVGS